MKTTILMAVLMGVSICISAQSGAIHGKVVDEFGDPAPLASIKLINGANVSGTTSDLEGLFKIKPLAAGTYTVEVSFIGYKTININGVNVSNNKITFLEDIVLTSDFTFIEVIDIVYYKDLISADEPQKMEFPSKIIMQSGGSKGAAAIVTRLVSDAIIVNNQMVIRGSRPGSSTVYIDGMRVTDEMSSLPSLGIGSVEVYTGGIPSRYGDVTGGVVMMTMKGYFDILSERRATESME
jgi:hypothetical protein